LNVISSGTTVGLARAPIVKVPRFKNRSPDHVLKALLMVKVTKVRLEEITMQELFVNFATMMISKQ
jgi:hypothetical protein